MTTYHNWSTGAGTATSPANAYDGAIGNTSTFASLNYPGTVQGNYSQVYACTTSLGLLNSIALVKLNVIRKYNAPFFYGVGVAIYYRWVGYTGWYSLSLLVNTAKTDLSTETFVIPTPWGGSPYIYLNELEVQFACSDTASGAAQQIYDISIDYSNGATTTLNAYLGDWASGSIYPAYTLWGDYIKLRPIYTGWTPKTAVISANTGVVIPSAIYSNYDYTTNSATAIGGDGNTNGTAPWGPITFSLTADPGNGQPMQTASSPASVIMQPQVFPPSVPKTYLYVGDTMTVSSGGYAGITYLSYQLAPVLPDLQTFYAGQLGPVNITNTVFSTSGARISNFVTVYVVEVPRAINLVTNAAYDSVAQNGTAFTLTPTFSGGTATINGVGAVTSGVAYTVYQASNSTVGYTLTVTNLAGTVATFGPLTITTIPPPSISGFTSNVSTIVIGGTVYLTPTFSGTAAQISISGPAHWTGAYSGSSPISVTSGGNYYVTLDGTATFTLFVVNGLSSVSVPLTVTAFGNPTIDNFIANTTNPLYGSPVILTAYMHNGTGVIGTSGAGSTNVTASIGNAETVTTTPLSATTYTLTVSNGGVSVNTSLTVTPQTVLVSAPSPTTVIGTGLSRTFSASVSGAANTAVSWSHSGVSGSWSGSTFTPSSAGTVRITATSVADPSKSNYSDVVIVDPPTITFTTSNSNPLRGTTGVVITPTHNGVSAIVGTSQGDNSISGSATSGTPITVQGSGFTTTTTYWVRAYNAAGLWTDASITINVQTVTVMVAGANSFAQGGSGAFNVVVTGAVDTSVTWSVDGGSGYGTFSGNTYTAPTGAGVPANATVRATAVADVSKSGSKLVAIQAVSVNTISPVGTSLSTLATQVYTATVSGATNTSVSWTTNFGTINSAGLYTAPNTGGTATITASSISDPSKSLSTTATITASPVISSFSSSISSPLVGQSYTVVPVYSNGSGVVDRSIGALASGVASSPIMAGLSPITYTLTVTNSILITATSTLVVTPQTIGVVLSPSSISINGATTQQFTAVLSGAVNTAVTWSVDGGAVNGSISSTGLYTSPSASPGYPITVRATSVIDPSKSATATVTITTIVVTLGQSSATVTAANTFSTIATVTGSSNIAIMWSAIGGGIVSGSVYTAPASPGTYTLRATSVADPTKHADCSITVVRMPVIGAFTSTSLTPLFGSSVSLSGIFGDGVGVIDGGIGTVTSGVGYSTPALSIPTTYTLTVTNAAGSYVSRSLTMIPTSLSITVNPSSYVAVVSEIFTFTATVLLAGSGSNGKTWSTSGGSIDPSTGVFTAPSTPTPIGSPITVTATSVADPTKYSTALVSVVYPIYSGKKSATSSS